MKCHTCRKGWIDIDVAGEVSHDICPDCNGTGQTRDPIIADLGNGFRLVAVPNGAAITDGDWYSVIYPHFLDTPEVAELKRKAIRVFHEWAWPQLRGQFFRGGGDMSDPYQPLFDYLDAELGVTAEAHAALIAEAGTVTNQTNRTPAELAALVRELRSELQRYYLDTLTGHIQGDPKTKALLAKSEGV